MNITFISFGDLKRKFGKLLSLLYHKANIELDNITEVLINSSFLDMLEDNRIDEFMAIPNEAIANALFPNVIIDDSIQDDIGAIYWSGIQYINIYLNSRIPLRTIFLICSLKEMVGKYDVYHETNELNLFNEIILNNYSNHSIVEYYRKKAKLSVRELSVLTNIPSPTLRSLESNSNLFNSKYSTIESVQRVLMIPSTILKKKSDFLPVNYYLLLEQDYCNCVKKSLESLTGKTFDSFDVTVEESIKTGSLALIIGTPSFLIIKNKRILVDENILKSVLYKSVDIYLEYLPASLVF